MPRHTLHNLPGLLPLLLLASALAGCTAEPEKDPFELDNRSVEVQPPIQTVIGTTFGTIGYAIDAIGMGGGESPREHAAYLASDASTPDQRFRGLNGLSSRGFGQQPPYTEVYADLAADDPNALVRAASVRALNRSRASAERDVLINRLGDESPLVRLEAAKALGHLPAPEAALPLLELALDADEDLDVRLAAVASVRHYRSPAVKDGLIDLIDGDEFSLAFQSRAALMALTGKDAGYDAAAWREVELPAATSRPGNAS